MVIHIMNLHFEEWVKLQHFNTQVNILFEEAIICYRSKAYRAALLFSFTGFQKILKEKMLKADIPRTYNNMPGAWEQILTEIRDDDKSDHKIISCVIQNKTTNTIFDLSEDVRNQYVYWKNRRNDCAHGKDNIIDISHVEAFWFFIQSNIGKFNINGGKEALINKIRAYLDINVTPEKQSPHYLLAEIMTSIHSEELNEVLKTLIEEYQKGGYWEVIESFEPKMKKFLMALSNLPAAYLEVFINYLEDNPLTIRALAEDDVTILKYVRDPVVIRNLWINPVYWKRYSDRSYPIMTAMLKYNLILEADKKEVFEFCLRNYTDNYFASAKQIDFQILDQAGFIQFFKIKAFEENKINDFNWSDRKKNLVRFYLYYSENIDEIVVNSLERTFNQTYYPKNLRTQIRHLFNTDKEAFEKIKKAFEKYNSVIPENLL